MKRKNVVSSPIAPVIQMIVLITVDRVIPAQVAGAAQAVKMGFVVLQTCMVAMILDLDV